MGFWSMAFFIMMGAVFYIASRAKQAFAPNTPHAVYWSICGFIIAGLVLLGRLQTSSFWTMIFKWIGAYSMGLIYYAFFVLLLVDIVILMDRRLGFIPMFFRKSPARIGFLVITVLVGILSYGTWNAFNPVFKPYELNIPKNAANYQTLHVIMISDLHLGNIVNNERLAEIVDQINQRNPDLVLLAGDVVDGDIKPFLQQDMTSTLKQLHPKIGTYMVLGNHDGHGTDEIPYMEAAGIQVLRDQYRLVDNSFYIIGRDNRGHQGMAASRADLKDIMVGINKQLPIILLDHNPSNLEEARTNGVDLQLSGHTHQGQIFPNNLITANMYEIDWGYLRKDNLQVIVSTGFGTWGPPIRIGSTPEVVELTFHFG